MLANISPWESSIEQNPLQAPPVLSIEQEQESLKILQLQTLQYIGEKEEALDALTKLNLLGAKCHLAIDVFEDDLNNNSQAQFIICKILANPKLTSEDEELILELLPFFIKTKCPLNISTSPTIPLLITWAAQNRFSLIEKTLLFLKNMECIGLSYAESIDLNAVDDHARNAFYMACKKNCLETVEIFLNSPMNDKIAFNQNSHDDFSAFLKACIKDHLGLVSLLLKYPQVNPNQTLDSASPLLYACSKEKIELVKILLQSETVAINSCNPKFPSTFLIACKVGNIEIINLLLSKPALDLNTSFIQEDGALITPYGIAYLTKRFDILELLLNDERIFPNALVENGYTLLGCALLKENIPLINKLLGHPNIDLKKGFFLSEKIFKPILEVEMQILADSVTANDESAITIHKKNLALLLTHSKTDPNIQFTSTSYLIFELINLHIKKGVTDLLEMLISHPHFNPNLTHEGTTILSRLITLNYLSLTKKIIQHPNLFLNRTFDISQDDRTYIFNPLTLALKSNNIDMAKLFLSHKKCKFNLHMGTYFFVACRNSDEIITAQFSPELRKLVRRYQDHPKLVQRELYTEVWGSEATLSIYALTVLISDELLTIRRESRLLQRASPYKYSSKGPPLFTSFGINIQEQQNDIEEENQMRRFFAIAKRLPIEVQMLLCHRVGGSAKITILSKDVEPEFKNMIRPFLPYEPAEYGWIVL